MHQPLQQLAEIRGGYSFRTGIVHDLNGDVGVLQIKDITGGVAFHEDALPRANLASLGSTPLLKSGDIVLPARGEHYDAQVLNPKGPLIASSQLFVLQTSSAHVLQDYLGWYLNQTDARNFILKNRVGSSIPMLNITTLGELPVPVPDLDTQRRIVALQNLWQRERSLTLQLLETRKKTLDGVFSKLLES